MDTEVIDDLFFDDPEGPPDAAVHAAKPKNRNTAPKLDATPSTRMGLNNLVLDLGSKSGTQLVAIRLPINYNVDGLARLLVEPGAVPATNGDMNERPLPYLFKLGPKAFLLVVCFTPQESSATNINFGLRCLDEITWALAVRDKSVWRLEQGPKFWDFDAGRWIRSRDWKGSKKTPWNKK